MSWLIYSGSMNRTVYSVHMVEKNPTVSVIIPTYNRADLLGRAIQSFRGHGAEVYIEPATIMFNRSKEQAAEAILSS